MKLIDNFTAKVKILTMFFNMYGYGNFDLTKAEIGQIFCYLVEYQGSELEAKLRELYERLEKDRLG